MQSRGTKSDLRSMTWSYGLDSENRSAAFFLKTLANSLYREERVALVEVLYHSTTLTDTLLVEIGDKS